MSVISYAVQSRQKNIRLRSTSGGTFSEIARSFIKTGGCVCAAGYDEQGKVVHKLINTISEIDELCESKYVQSNLNNCFAEVESCLSSSRKVLFVGTPCQVAGVKAYLRNKDEKLYTIDLVCYGVPSPMIYIEWRAEIERVYKKKIAYVHFRDKSFGYAAPNVKIVFKDSGYYREQAVNSRVARAIKTVFTALEVVNQGMQEKKSITLQCVDVDDLKKQAEMIRAEQIKLYESYADGILTRNEYLEKKKGLGEKLADLQEKIRIEEEEQETADELDEEIRSLTKQASQKTYIGGLTKECVDAFVSMVYLYDDQTMKVEFNCEDVIRRALEKYGA